MSKLELLRLSVKHRLDAAAEDIFGLFDETKAGYEEELSRLREYERQHILLDAKVRLCRSELLRLSVKQLLDAAAEDIGGMFDETKADDEEELSRLREYERQHKLLDSVFNPRVILYRSDVPPEWSPGLDQEDPELWISPEGDQLSNLVDKIKTEGDGEDCGGLEPARDPDPDSHSHPDIDEEKPFDSSETEFCYNDWQEALSDCGAETEDSDSDRMETRTPESAVNALKCKVDPVSDVACNTVKKKSFSFFKSSQRFHYKGFLKKHMKCNFGKKSSRCLVRNKCVRVKQKADRQTMVKTGEKPFECNVCGEIVKQKKNIQRHMRVHTGERPFRCDVCGKTFNQQTNVKRHMRIHTGEKPFGCDICGRSFNQKGSLKAHIKVHTGEKPFGCGICGRSFIEQAVLKSHMNVHTGQKSFACDFCGKIFIRQSTLNRHIRVHTGEKPFACDVCGKRFAQQCHRKTHMRVHTREKAFGCDVCGKRFKRETYLKSHMKVHTGEKTFLRDVSGKSFNQQADLKSQIKIHTG